MIREYAVLAISGIWDIPIETIRTRKPGPNIEERKRDSIIELMLFMESDNSQEKKETMPLPAIRKERRTPRKTDIKVITRASVMDIRAPSERRERKSLPYISVPRGWEEEKEEREILDAITENSSLQIVCIMNHDPQMEEAMRQRVELALSGKGREGSSGPAGNAESFAAQSGPESDFYKGNLRSGQVLESASNVTLIGDVNPGARIVSQGNIVVLGSLRGNAWAGAGGDSRCFIFALDMKPIQLQIGDYIAKSPDREREKKRLFGKGRSEEAEMPRVALVREGNICIEPMTKGCLDQI